MANINFNEVFIPVTNGNDRAEKPIKFHLRFLTAAEQSEVDYFEYTFVEGQSKPKVKAKVNSAFYFSRGVEKVEGLDGVETAEQFLTTRGPKWMGDMVHEVALHLRNAMEIDRPN